MTPQHSNDWIFKPFPHTATKAASKPDPVGVAPSLVTRCSFTIETMKFALNFASSGSEFCSSIVQNEPPKILTKELFVETDECSLLGYLLKAIDEYKQMSKMEFWSYTEWYFQKLILSVIDNGVTNSYTLGASRGFSRVRWEFPVLSRGSL